MRFIKMELAAVILILLVGPAFKTCSAQSTVGDIVASCNDPTCKAPFCFGHSIDETKKSTCSAKISMDDCDSAIGAIVYDSTTKKYQFKLAGKVDGAKGWVGIGFAEGTEVIGKWPGVACLDNGDVVLLETKDPMLTKFPLLLKNVPGGTSKVDSGWLTCEFEINAEDTELGFIKLNEKEKKGIFLFGNTKTGADADLTSVMAEYMDNMQSQPVDIFSALAGDVKNTEGETKNEQTGLDGAASLAAGLILIGFSLVLTGIGQQC